MQSDQSLCLLLEYSITVKLLTERHLEFLSLKARSTGSSESIHVKMPHCWKSHVAAHRCFIVLTTPLGICQVESIFPVCILADRPDNNTNEKKKTDYKST